MTERPILFSAQMVRAILAGTKTQTRRAVKWRGVEPGLNLQFSGLSAFRIVETWVLESPSRTSSEWRCQPTYCPYGVPGDRLWVRETWAPKALDPECTVAAYRATDDPCNGPWRPSIHMPRWASRITLEVTRVRVERLQAISEADARAEGAHFHDGYGVGHSGWRHDFGDVHSDARSSFARLWSDINGADSWSANPWVWVVEFRLQTTGDR